MFGCIWLFYNKILNFLFQIDMGEPNLMDLRMGACNEIVDCALREAQKLFKIENYAAATTVSQVYR